MTVYDSSPDSDLGRRLAALVALSQNDEACRLLGADGVLEAQLDLTFIDDPLDWVAFDIGMAVKSAAGEDIATDNDEEETAPTLATLVAELRLYRIVAGDIDEAALLRKVREYV